MPANNSEQLPSLAVIPKSMALPVPAGAVERMRQSLLNMRMNDLKALARVRDAKVRSVSRDGAVVELVEPLLDAGVNAAILSGQTNELQRAVLAVMLFGQDYGAPRRLSSVDLQQLLRGWNARNQDVLTAIDGLRQKALLLPAPSQERDPTPPWQVNPGVQALALPLLPALRSFGGRLPASNSGGPDALARLLRGLTATATALEHSRAYNLPLTPPSTLFGLPVYAVRQWLVAGEMPPRTTQVRTPRGQPRTGVLIVPPQLMIPESALDRLTQAAGNEDNRHSEFYIRLLIALGILYRSEQDFQTDPHDWRTFADLPEHARLNLIITQLRNGASLGELDLLSRYDPQISMWVSPSLQYADPQMVLSDVARLRQALMQLLGWLPVGSWYDMESALVELRRLYPEIPLSFDANQPEWQDTIWWLQRSTTRPSSGLGYLDRHEAHGWRESIGRLVIAMLAGPLSWLGLVEVVTKTGEPLVAGAKLNLDDAAGFRVTALGGELLSQRPRPLLRTQPPAGRSEGSSAAVAPNQPDLIHAKGLNLDQRLLLSSFAEPLLQSADTATFRLNKASAVAGFDAGVQVDDMIRLLDRLAGPHAASMGAQLREWWAQYGRLHIYSGVALIELRDEFVRGELLAGTKLADYVIYEFSPRLLLVREEDVDAITTMLGRAGQAARVVDDGIGGAA